MLEPGPILNGFWRLEEGQDEHRRHEPNWQVDVEAPPPRNVIRQCTSHQRSRNTSNTKHSPNHTCVQRSSMQLYRLRDDENRSGE